MSDFAGDDLFVFDDFGDGAVFDNDPFDGDGGDTVDEFCVSGFAFPDGDDGGEFCVSAFSFPEGDENMVVHDHASQASDKDPVLETLGRSFDSDEEGLSVFIPDLVCAISSTLDLNENSSGEEPAGGDEYVEEFILGGGPDRQPGLVIEEAAGDDSEDFFGFMPSEIDLDPQPVTGGFQTLVDVDEGVDVVAGDDDHLRLPAFRMLVEDVDSDGDDILEVLALRAGQIHARSPLSASRAVVEALPEVAPTEEEASSPCAVCKDGIAGQLVVRLPCKHFFHGDCIRPWLLIRNTCPVCRNQLPTGNPEYDRQRPADGGASPVQDGAMPQNGGAGGRTNVISEDAPGCSGGGN